METHKYYHIGEDTLQTHINFSLEENTPIGTHKQYCLREDTPMETYML